MMTPAWFEALTGLAASTLLALFVWAWSLRLDDVSIVDIAWGFLVLAPVLVVAGWQPGSRAATVTALAAAWALRLAGHIAWRHRGQPEDPRYQEMRARHGPSFAWKSLYLVFGLQAVLAWIVSAPVAAAAASTARWHVLDGVGMVVVAFGLLFEAVADEQLTWFKAQPASRGQVMCTGLWRYSRHPNYFGECCIWWGFWIISASAGAVWTVVSPLLMTALLLKVSGVTLLERHIVTHRPGYEDYVRHTNAFIPWRPRP